MIIRPGTTTRNLGKLVICERLAFDDMWEVEALSLCHKTTGEMGRWGFIEDSRLRPIRPGDISDEEVRDLYLPAPQKETA